MCNSSPKQLRLTTNTLTLRPYREGRSLYFKYKDDKGVEHKLHEAGDCLLVVAPPGQLAVTFEAVEEDGRFEYVYGDVTLYTSTSNGSDSWGPSLVKNGADTGIALFDISEDPGFKGIEIKTNQTIAKNQIVRFQLDKLYWLKTDDKAHEADHPDPNIVIKTVDDPATSSDFPKRCDGSA